jgi:hypothetical protein
MCPTCKNWCKISRCYRNSSSTFLSPVMSFITYGVVFGQGPHITLTYIRLHLQRVSAKLPHKRLESCKYHHFTWDSVSDNYIYHLPLFRCNLSRFKNHKCQVGARKQCQETLEREQMNGEIWLLVTDEPVEVQDFRKITYQFRGICRIYLQLL